MRRSTSHDDLSIISENISSTSQVEFEGFVVDVVEQVLSTAGPLHVQWLVDTGPIADSSLLAAV